MNKQVRLKDGSEVPAPLVVWTLLVLDGWAKSKEITNTISLYELTMASRNPGHEFFGDYAERLAKAAMVDPATGRPHRDVARIVRNAVIGDDPGMADWRVVSPLDLEKQP